MSRVMVDLFSGRGGWVKGFQAHGWHCIAIDINPQSENPADVFIQADIAHLYELPEADFYCCSPPCEQFSVHGMKHFHPNPKWPWLGIALFEHARKLIEATGKPYVMENVRAAQRFIGKAGKQCGSFLLWGSGLPILWPPDFGFQKGISTSKKFRDALRKGIDWPRPDATGRRDYRQAYNWTSSGSKARKEATAKAAEIPFPLASHIAQTAGGA